jgi:hypothetical protein
MTSPSRHSLTAPGRKPTSPRRGRPMTVCIATLFQWNYGTRENPVWGRVALLVSDRQITVGSFEYEPPQLKIASITDRALIMIAGQYYMHTEAILMTNQQVRRDSSTKPMAIASIYAHSIQSIRRREAEDTFLAPLGLNTDTFLAQQHEYSSAFVKKITGQLQGYAGNQADSLLVASDGDDVHLVNIDSYGMIKYMNDVGFDAIGSGAEHAKSRLMQSG